MIDIFLKEKPVKALTSIGRKDEQIYASQVAQEINTTYSHTVKIISRLKDENLVDSEKLGRKKVLTLTDKGEMYAELFDKLIDLADEDRYDIISDQTTISDAWESSKA